jgi:hypothetical protein
MMRIVALGTFTKIIVTGGIRVLDFILELIRGMGHWKWVVVPPTLFLVGLKNANDK